MIIFLYGEDSFRSKQKLDELKNKYLETDKAGTGLSVFDAEELVSSVKDSLRNIMSVINTPNMLAPKRLLTIKNLIETLLAEDQKNILEFLKKEKQNLLEDKDLIIIFWEKNQPKKNNALYKFLEKETKQQNFEKLTGAKLEAWALKKILEFDPTSKISAPALQKLIAYTNSDNFLLSHEIEKLANYSSGKMISENDVEKLVKSNLNNNIFATIEALGRNDKKEALKLVYKHLEKGDDPFYLMSMFFYQFRNMLKISDLYEKNIRSEYEIARLTKLHPFVVKKSLSQVRNFSLAKLKNIYQKLSRLDTAAKTGRIDIKLALDKFVAEI